MIARCKLLTALSAILSILISLLVIATINLMAHNTAF